MSETTTKSKINDNVLAIAEALEKNLVLKDNSVTEEVADGADRTYYVTAQTHEGLDREAIDKTHRHDANFAAAAVLAGGRRIQSAFGDSKETQTATINVLMGDVINAEGKASNKPNSIEATLVTNRTIHKPGSTTGETTEVPVTIMPAFNTVVDGKTGGMGAVVTELKSLFGAAAAK